MSMYVTFPSQTLGSKWAALKIIRALSHFQTLKDEGKSCPENAKVFMNERIHGWVSASVLPYRSKVVTSTQH